MSLFCSLDSDPLLSLISTRLATRGDRGPRSNPAAISGAPSDQTTLDSWRLPAAVQQWEVCWEELTLSRAVGRGSFGRVYLATWRETPVAVKVGQWPPDPCMHGWLSSWVCKLSACAVCRC